MSKRQDGSPPGKGASITTTIQIPAEALTFVAAPPETLSQRTVEALTGIPSRAYLEAVRVPGFPIAVMRLGKLRIVDRAGFMGWLRRQAGRAVAPMALVPANDADEDAGLKELAAELGLEPAKQQGKRPGGRR
ncbi:MAG: hypothetical protein ABJE95_29260 [Byssovorax sp.]